MRVSLEFDLKNNTLPIDYRRGFISLIKATLNQGENASLLFDRLYSQKTNKALTFSVYFPEIKGKNENKFVVGGKANLLLSSNDLEIVTNVYNGSFMIKDYPLFNNKISFKKAFFIQKRKITSDSVLFRTKSPLLLNLKGDNLNYITPEHPEYIKALINNAFTLSETFLNHKPEYINIKVKQWRKLPVSHYNQTMTAIKGIFEIETEPELLQLLYDIGLGVRRSQGFGMLEIT